MPIQSKPTTVQNCDCPVVRSQRSRSRARSSMTTAVRRFSLIGSESLKTAIMSSAYARGRYQTFSPTSGINTLRSIGATNSTTVSCASRIMPSNCAVVHGRGDAVEVSSMRASLSRSSPRFTSPWLHCQRVHLALHRDVLAQNGRIDKERMLLLGDLSPARLFQISTSNDAVAPCQVFCARIAPQAELRVVDDARGEVKDLLCIDVATRHIVRCISVHEFKDRAMNQRASHGDAIGPHFVTDLPSIEV